MNRRHFIELFSGPSASSPGAFSGPSSRDNLDASDLPPGIYRDPQRGVTIGASNPVRGGALASCPAFLHQHGVIRLSSATS